MTEPEKRPGKYLTASGRLATDTMPSLRVAFEERVIDAARMGYGETVTATPSHINEAREAIPAWRAVTEPASVNERMQILRDLADLVGMPEALRSSDPARIGKFFAAYHEDLGRLPGYVLANACAEYRRRPMDRPKFFPDSGTLLSIVRQDEDWRRAQLVMKGLERLAKAKPDAARAYVGTDEEERALSSALGDLVKRINATEESEIAERRAEARQTIDALKAKAAAERPFDHSILLNRHRSLG